MDEGRLEGRLEASRALVLRQLHLKFSTVSPAARAIVEAADAVSLERYAERVLTAGSAEDVLRPDDAR